MLNQHLLLEKQDGNWHNRAILGILQNIKLTTMSATVIQQEMDTRCVVDNLKQLGLIRWAWKNLMPQLIFRGL